MLGIKSQYVRGDTLIEALFAISVFSLVAVGGLSIMNKGTNIAQRALEITLVRQQIDAQSEALRFLNSSYIASFNPNVNIAGYASGAGYAANTPADQWALLSRYIIENPASSATAFGPTASNTCPGLPVTNAFVFDAHKAKVQRLIAGIGGNYVEPTTFARVRYDASGGAFLASDGLWIEAVRSHDGSGTAVGTGYTDFHIRACWTSLGQAVPMTLGTIVRLYDPR